METKKIYEILVDDLNGLDDDHELCKAFMLFVLGAAQSIIQKTAQSISESGEIPTIKKCIDKLDDDTRLKSEIFVILRIMLTAKMVVDDKWNPDMMDKIVKINFDVIGEDFQRFLQDKPDEGKELD